MKIYIILKKEWFQTNQQIVNLSRSNARSEAAELISTLGFKQYDLFEDAVDSISEGYEKDLLNIKTQVKEEIQIKRFYLLLGYIGILGLAVCASIILFSSLLKRLSIFQDSFNTIATGDADLTRRLSTHGKDEIAQLSRIFNSFADEMHSIISNLNHMTKSSEIMKNSNGHPGK